jgi:hypothetical protein
LQLYAGRVGNQWIFKSGDFFAGLGYREKRVKTRGLPGAGRGKNSCQGGYPWQEKYENGIKVAVLMLRQSCRFY